MPPCPVLDHEADDKTAHDGFVGDGEFATILDTVADERDDAQRAAKDRSKRAETDINGLQKGRGALWRMDERWGGPTRP